jgi:hypothetical protein
MKDYSLFVFSSYLITTFILLVALIKSVITYFALEKKYYQKLYGKTPEKKQDKP